ncbi:MAG: MG2 domain-containing protein [Pirellulaceae bacterium]
MSRRVSSLRWVAGGLMATLAAGLFWQATFAQKAADKPAAEEPKQPTTTEILGGENRYLTFVSTDKAIYKPGDTIYMRAVMLHHATREPLQQGISFGAQIDIAGPKGDTVAGGWVEGEDSVLGYKWEIPAEQPGGEYTIKLKHMGAGHAPAERKFDIRAYRAPRLKSQIKFLRDGYGPGDEVVATLHTERAEGGVPAGAAVTVIARVDGDEVFRGPSSVDAKGDCQARFALPGDIRRGEGTLAMVIEDGGVVETASKTIPILLQTVDLTMYPEGGDLVAGLPTRVYFEAFTPAKKPADLAGVVIDGAGAEIAQFRSEHDGRGRFAMTPKAGEKYLLKITEPAGIRTQYPLPEVKASGVVLSSQANVIAADAKPSFTLGATAEGEYTLVLRQRDIELARQSIELTAGQTKDVALELKKDAENEAGREAELDLGRDPAGVLIATVYDAAGKPVAERLVYRQPSKSLQITITPNQPQYTPGGKAKVTVETRDASGKPVSAVVGLTVTDDSVLEMIDKRDQAPRLPVMVFLEGEVKELADAHVYLDPENEKAPLAVDLLLGTQGWRRFALVDTAKFLAGHGDKGRRVLALTMVSPREQATLMGGFGGGGPKAMRFRGVMPAMANRIEEKADPAEAFQNGAEGDAVDAAAPPRAPVPGPVPDAAVAPVAEQPPANDPQPAGEPVANDGARKLREANQAAGAAAPRAFDAKRRAAKPQDIGQAEQLEERRELGRALQAAELAQEADMLIAADRPALVPQRNDFTVVRVYAHQVRADRQPGERTDFTETLFWHAGLRTDADGKAEFEFGLNDSVSSFRIFADAYAASGAIGSKARQIDSVEPFYLEPKLPLEVTSGDLIRVPVGVVNATPAPLEAAFGAKAHTSLSITSSLPKFALPGDGRIRRMVDVQVGPHNGEAEFVLTANALPYSDKVTRTLKVVPRGFPILIGRGGLIGPGDTATHEISIPEEFVPGSVNARVLVYPTPLASMNEALEGLIREPYGCFEQTSSTTYPLVMAQQYFMSHQGVDPSLVERSSLILETAYQRLTGFECKNGGYEWFGNDPGHDALTAYGLLEFTDMAKVRHVDDNMLRRTRDWLLTQRDGKGGYARKTHTLHTWLADPECASTYDTWALLSAGVDADLSKEVEFARSAGESTDNTYVMALAANVLVLAGDKEGEEHLLDKLAGKQADDGSLEGATTSVVGSGGEALKIETTALAVTAWLNNPGYVSQVEKGIQYLAETCKAGRFGSTQSTVLALRAIVAYDASRAKPKSPGSLELLVDGQVVGEPVSFTAETEGAIELPALAELLTAGEHKVQLRMTDGSQMPYSVAVDFHSLKPDTSADCKLHLEVSLRDAKIDEGAVTEAEVAIINRTGEDVPTPTAIIGIPGGLEVRHDQLKELVKAGKIAAYEVKGREVVLYWRVLSAEQRVDLPLSLVAAVPGNYTAPASRAYLYYTDEHKHWVDGLAVEITPVE